MPRLKVATYNLHSCVGGDRRYDPERIVNVLHEIGADILALQEVGGYPVDDLEQVHYFEVHLGMKAVVGLKPRRMRVQHANAILVKGNIQHATTNDLTIFKFEPRNVIDAILETAAGRIRVIATHLGLLSPERRRQVERLREIIAAGEGEGMPTVVMGDFNIFGRERAILHRIGAPRPLPVLRSFPARRPLMSLDRIWTLPNERLASLHLHRTALSRLASDHLPLVGEVEL